MTADRWQVVPGRSNEPKADVQFVRKEGFPQGVLVLKQGEAALNGLVFADGTIEFDLKPLTVDIPGITFRRDARNNGEEFYIRSFPDCRAENDCIQYAPVINGFMLWNAYPQYQTSADVLEGWNHVKLVVSGRRMNVFLNHSPVPALRVGSLQSDAVAGGVRLRGPAFFANLTIQPNAVEGLAPTAVPDPAQADRTIVRQWALSPLAPLNFGKPPNYAEMHAGRSADPRPWRQITSDASGFANLNRQFQAGEDPPALVWLRTEVTSTSDQPKRIAMGWIGQVWIFVNGKPVTEGKNFYYPDAERRDPDGRLSFDNGSFDIPLVKGHNEIALALYSSVRDNAGPRTAYGWGLQLKFQDIKGLSLQRPLAYASDPAR